MTVMREWTRSFMTYDRVLAFLTYRCTQEVYNIDQYTCTALFTPAFICMCLLPWRTSAVGMPLLSSHVSTHLCTHWWRSVSACVCVKRLCGYACMFVVIVGGGLLRADGEGIVCWPAYLMFIGHHVACVYKRSVDVVRANAAGQTTVQSVYRHYRLRRSTVGQNAASVTCDASSMAMSCTQCVWHAYGNRKMWSM